MWKSAYDCVNSEDPEGRTYKEINLAKSHKIPCGTLVELDDGVRLWVVHLDRDCDGTPVYYLSPNRDDPQETPGLRNKTWTGACSEIRLEPVGQYQASWRTSGWYRAHKKIRGEESEILGSN